MSEERSRASFLPSRGAMGLGIALWRFEGVKVKVGALIK